MANVNQVQDLPCDESWKEISLSLFQRLAVKVITSGKVPKHIAVIMDGNRRFAKKQNVKLESGHAQGFDKLLEMLQWCIITDIKELTVYALSIDNLKRTEYEVNYLFDLARSRLQRLIDERQKLEESGICIRLIGNPVYIPLDVRKLLARLMLETCNNRRIVLNLAFMYTSRDEMAHAIRNVANGIVRNEILVEDVDEGLLSKCMYTHKSSDPELIIRTSGEVRLSDFMMWQSTGTYLHFADVLWPDFSLWSLLKAIFKYQKFSNQCEIIHNETSKKNAIDNTRADDFVNKLNQKREASMRALLKIKA